MLESVLLESLGIFSGYMPCTHRKSTFSGPKGSPVGLSAGAQVSDLNLLK